jgi:hypothetical protein
MGLRSVLAHALPHTLHAALQKGEPPARGAAFFDSARRRAAAFGGTSTYHVLGFVHSLAARLVLRGFLRARGFPSGSVAALRARVPQPLTRCNLTDWPTRGAEGQRRYRPCLSFGRRHARSRLFCVGSL